MTEKPYFPVYLDLSQKKVVLIGQAPDIYAKARHMARYCGQVEVLIPIVENVSGTSPENESRWKSCPEGKNMSAADEPAETNIKTRHKKYERDDLYGADLVISFASSSEINEDVYASCRCLGIPVCIEADEYKRDFHLTDRMPVKPADTIAFFPAKDDHPKTAEPEADTSIRVTMYTDGSARGNPDGPGGYGTILEFRDSAGEIHVREYSRGYKKTTNNRMELMAAIAGFRHLKVSCAVDVYSDSKYLTDAFNQHWIDGWKKSGWKHMVKGQKEPVKNQDLWNQLLEAMNGHTVTFHWVKGHNGHPQNERCDEMAVSAALSDDLSDEDTDI